MSDRYEYIVQVAKYDVSTGDLLAHEEYGYTERPLLIAVENPDEKLVNDVTGDHPYWRYVFNGAEYNIMKAEEGH